MSIFLYFNIFTLVILSCNSQVDKIPIPTYSVKDTLIVPQDSTSLYFPLARKDQDSITNANALDTFSNTWYSQMLYHFREPTLREYSGNKEIFRFTWLRTFHNPVVVRLQKHGDSVSLHLKVLDGAGGYDPGKLYINKVLTITSYQWDEFLKKFQAIEFYAFPSLEKNRSGKDGSEWILEAVRQNKYHFATRWSVGYSDFAKCCVYLLELSKLQIPENQKY